LPADVFLDPVGHGHFAEGYAALVVAELDIVHKE
jgi:hypothetical protein